MSVVNQAEDLLDRMAALERQVRDVRRGTLPSISTVEATLPYLGYHVMPWSQVLSPPQFTTSAVMETLHRIHGRRQNPWLYVLLVVQSDADTTGEVQVAEAGAALTPATPVDGAADGYVWIDAPLPGGNLDAKYLDVQARRTGGTGAIRVGVASVLDGPT